VPRKTQTRPARGRGHARQLDRDKIVEAALALTREDGAAAPSMRQVAARLEVDVSALYWHFPNKAALLAAAAQTAAGSVQLAVPEAGPWQRRALELCRGIRAQLQSHPELSLHEIGSTWTTPFNAVATGQLAVILEDAGLPPRETIFAAQGLIHLVTAITQSQQITNESSQDGIVRFVRTLEPVLPERLADDWRALVRLPTRESFDAYFESSVRALVSGLSAQAERSVAGPAEA
jgi:AcrR family transcriptional regulator